MLPRLHIVGLPHTQTTRDYLTCAYSQKIVKGCKMLRQQGYEVILYSGEHNDAECDEHVQLVSEAERHAWFGDGFDTVKTPLRWDPAEPYWQLANTRAAAEIAKRRAAVNDQVLLIGGDCQQPIAAALPGMLACEWGVGYLGIFSNYCAFESDAWRHYVYGHRDIRDGRWYDATIPNYFDRADFPELERTSGDYLLFVGRLILRKGPHVAAQIAQRLGMKLLVAGPGYTHTEKARTRKGKQRERKVICSEGTEDEVVLEGDVEYVGVLDAKERSRLMAGAVATLVPTLYIEPFGGVAVESMMAGTPVVASNYGAFRETVLPGVTGETFGTLAEGAAAVGKVRELDRAKIRQHALDHYSLEAVGPRFARWLGNLDGLWGVGWDA